MENYVLVFPIALLLIWIFFKWNYEVRFEVPFIIRIIYGLPFIFMAGNVTLLSSRIINLGSNKLIVFYYCIFMTMLSVLNIIMDHRSIKLYDEKYVKRSIVLTTINYTIAISVTIFIIGFVLQDQSIFNEKLVHGMNYINLNK